MKSLFAVVLMLSMNAFAQECVKIRESKKAPNKSFNIVFVPSGFNDNLLAFEDTIRAGFEKISAEYPPFGLEIDSINIVITKPKKLNNSFCHKKDDGLLDCSFMETAELGRRCAPSGKKITIVMHNSNGEWIRGNAQNNHVVLTNHPRFVGTILHEMGHALFDLADEYSNGGPANEKNCSPLANKCSAWKDLIDAGLATCEPGCKGNQSFVDGNNIMKDSSASSYGHSNQRLICCRYKKVTGEFPQFCEEYRNIGEGLERYCRSR